LGEVATVRNAGNLEWTQVEKLLERPEHLVLVSESGEGESYRVYTPQKNSQIFSKKKRIPSILLSFGTPERAFAVGRYLTLPDVRAWLSERPEGLKLRMSEGILRSLPIPTEVLEFQPTARPSSLSSGILGTWTERFLQNCSKSWALQGSLENFRTCMVYDHERPRMETSLMLSLLDPSTMVPASLHPEVEIEGSLPLYRPIVRIETISSREVRVLTEANMSMTFRSESPILIQAIQGLLQRNQLSTWAELQPLLLLPREPERLENLWVDMNRELEGLLRELQLLDEALRSEELNPIGDL
jgi:hypothetical protein